MNASPNKTQLLGKGEAGKKQFSALVSVAIDFDVADIPGPAWKWPSLGK